MRYFVVVQAPAWSLGPDRCALESAFAVHLVELRNRVGPRFAELVLVGPSMTEADYRAQADRLAVLDATQTGVRFVPVPCMALSRAKFLLTRFPATWRWFRELFREPCVVQSGMSTELARPIMFMASLAARSRGRPVVFMVDMDFRKHAIRFYRTGQWSLKSFLVNRLVYDPLQWIQLWLAPRLFELCCYKGESLVRDFGGGRPNVRNFFDTVHAAEDVIDEATLATRFAERRRSRPAALRAVYFGRLASNKGIDRMIDAVAVARRGGAAVELRIIGNGECADALHAQIARLGLQNAVTLAPAVAYGDELFAQLDDCDVALAAPLIEDTPRAAFDAMARGLPLLAYDITYFADLARLSGAVVTTPWPRVDAMADALIALAADRQRIEAMATRAIGFARGNTQAIWLDRRLAWLREVAP